jgi:RHS repeat-associated protein
MMHTSRPRFTGRPDETCVFIAVLRVAARGLFSPLRRLGLLLRRNAVRALSLFLVICLFSASAPAAPVVLGGMATQLSADASYLFRTRLLTTLAQGLGGQAHARQEAQSARNARVSRIEISPGDVTLQVGQSMIFAAIPYDQSGTPVGGVQIKWKARELGGRRQNKMISQAGAFVSAVPGDFTVTAEAAGARAEVTARVVNETGDPRPFTGEPGKDEQPLSTREVSTRDNSGEISASRGRDSRRRRAARRAGSGEARIVKASFSPAAEPAPQYQQNEFIWNDGNYMSADDPDNLRGNSTSAPADGGAGSGNFQIGAPVLDLSGRGIDLKLNLIYNSQVWSRSGSQITFDIDQDWPAAGWSLGFGRLIKMGTSGSMLVDADGTRHSYTGTMYNYSWGSRFVGYTTDSTFIDYSHSTNSNGVITSASASYPNGTVVYYGAPGRNAVYPTQISDANGNYITITYRNNSGPHIQTITDTLGRTVNFHYDASNLLTAVTGPGLNGTTRTLVRLQYRWLTLGYLFYGLTPQVRSQTVPVVNAIYYPATNTGFWFGDGDSYSTYGMIARVQEQHSMGFSAGSLNEQGSAWAGGVTSQRVYNYPMNTGDGYQTGPPAYTTQTETWDRMDTAPVVTTYSVQQNSYTRTVTITQPDGTRSVQYSYNAPNTWYDGLTYQDELYDSAGRLWRRSSATWQQGAYNSVRPVRNETVDEAGQVTAEEFSYGPQYNQVTEVRSYGFGGYELLRRTVTEYENGSAYINRHIFSLVKSVTVFDRDGVTRLSRTEYQYDGPGSAMQAAPGVTMHFASHNPHAPPVWVDEYCYMQCYNNYECDYICDPGYWYSPYSPSTDYRGNVTRVTSYTDAANLTGAVVETRGYDVTGNVVKVSASCCDEVRAGYGVDTQYAYPTSHSQGSADPNSPVRVTTRTTFDFNTGLPLTTTDANGRVSSTEFDAASLRPTIGRLPTGAYTTYTYGVAPTTVTETVHHAGGAVASSSVKRFNGRGQIYQELSQAAGGVWDIVETKYDQFGRVWKQSQPYRSGQAVHWNENFYDAVSRGAKAIGADGSIVETLYNEPSRPPGASSEPGTTKRSIDAWGRERWERVDAAGRIVEVAEPNASGSGSVLAAGAMITRYRYDSLGNLVEVTQGAQTRRFRYDSLGRMTHQKLAEASATLNDAGQYVGAGTWSHVFGYDERMNLVWQVDARGARTTFSYNNDPLNRLQSVSYSTAGVGDTSSPVEGAATISYQYATSGDLTRLARVVADGVSTEDFAYDAEGRPSRKTLTLSSRPGYPMVLEYTYNSLNQVTDVRYPSQYGAGGATKYVRFERDAASRLSALKVNGVDYGSQVTYNAGGQVTSLMVGSAGANQIQETYGYSDQTGLMSSQRVVRNGTALLDLSYDYWGAGARSGRTGQIKQITNNLNSSKSRTFDYDALGRLTKATNGSTWQERYTYDRYGNRTSVTSAAGIAAAPATAATPGVELAHAGTREELPDFLRNDTTRAVSDAAPLSPLALARPPQPPLPGLKSRAAATAPAQAATADEKAGAPPQQPAPAQTPTPTPATQTTAEPSQDGRTTTPLFRQEGPVLCQSSYGCGDEPQPPWAEPGGPYSGQPNQAIQFDGSWSYDPDGWITNYSWNFGDGTSSTLASPSKSYASPGTYSVSLRVRDNSGYWSSYSYTTATISNPTPVNGATFVSQTVPAVMNAGQQYSVSVTMYNSGTRTWTAADQHRLGSQNPQDNGTWGIGRVNVPASVAPGASATFNFTVTAPTAPGTYNFQWRMLQDGVEWFGGLTENVAVTVTQPAVGGCSGPAPCDGHPTISYDPATNRINSPGWLYDAAGNQIRAQRPDGSWQRYVYDAAGRLVTVRSDAGATLLSYQYGSTNRRLVTQEGGSGSNVRTYHVWEAGNVVAEYGESNASPWAPVWSKNYIYLGARLLATQEPSGGGGETVLFHHPDHLSTRLITNQPTGSVAEQANLPFGNAMLSESTGGTSRRFTSYTRDSISGLDNAVNRHYDPAQGRFTQVDPIGMKAVNGSDPQTLNLYAYCGNDPVNGTDPDGLFFGKLFKGIGKLFKGVAKIVGKVANSVGKVLSAVGTVMAKVLHNRWVMIGVSILSLVFPPLLAAYQFLSDLSATLQMTGLILQGRWKELVQTMIQSAIQWAINQVMDFVVNKALAALGKLQVLPACAIKALRGAMGGVLKGLDLTSVRMFPNQGWVTALGQDAITVGRNIYFGTHDSGSYSPTTRSGLILIGHELVHVVQYARMLNPVVFIGTYLTQWAAGGFKYGKIGLEGEAYKIGNDGRANFPPGKLDQMPDLSAPCGGG